MVGSFLYSIPAAVALFWIIRIILQKDVNRIQLCIIAGMLMALLTLFYREASALFMFPFFYLALRQKISEKGIVKWDWLLIFPSIFFIPFADTVYFGIFFACQLIAITVWAIVGIGRYNRKMAEIYDASSEMSADDIGHVLTFVIFTVIITTLATKIPDTLEYTFWIRLALALFLAVLQFYIGYYTLNVKDTSEIVSGPVPFTCFPRGAIAHKQDLPVEQHPFLPRAEFFRNNADDPKDLDFEQSLIRRVSRRI